MTTNPDRTDSPVATPDATAGQEPARPVPPAAQRARHERTHHGDTVVDEYAWLADKDNPETIAYLEAENAYTEAMTAGQAGLRETIFGEIKGRTQETDLSVPTRKGGWWYYTRTTRASSTPVHCRRAVTPGADRPAVAGRRAVRCPARRSCSTATSWPGTRRSSRSARSASARTARCWPTRPTSPATSASRCGSRT